MTAKGEGSTPSSGSLPYLRSTEAATAIAEPQRQLLVLYPPPVVGDHIDTEHTYAIQYVSAAAEARHDGSVCQGPEI